LTIHVDGLDIDDWFNNLTHDVDVWVTDPPYPFSSQNGTGRYKGMYTRFGWAKLGQVFEEMYKRTSVGGRAYVFCNRDGLHKTEEALKAAGFTYLNTLIWDKQHFGGGYHWRNQAEFIIYVSKGKPSIYVKNLSNIFNYKRPCKSDAVPGINYDPALTSSKPKEIWRDILVHGASQDEVCADPFSGSNPMRAAVLTEPALSSKFREVLTNVFIV